VFFSDGIRQTAADLMQLVRVIEVGIDVNGDGQADLDPSRIYYLGNSLGGGYGTVFLAVEPDVRAGALSAPVDPPALTQALQIRSFTGSLLGSRQPTLLNYPGITAIAGRTFPAFPPVGGQLYPFDENKPLRNDSGFSVVLEDASTRFIQSPVINTVPGAMAIQDLFDRVEWVSQAGGPVAYASHLQKAPLAGVSAKPALYQIAKGDEAAPNPTTTAILRAGGFTQWTYYLHDLYRSTLFPMLTTNPHTFAVSVTGVNANLRPISLGLQHQAAMFFLSDGNLIIQPEPSAYLELRNAGEWPEDFNYIP
jgi:hypothetical protein